jgi:hypothetical protein
LRTYNVSMSNRTIAKFTRLVILLACVAVAVGSCSHASSRDSRSVEPSEFSTDYNKPVVVGKIESNEITESSGLVASRCQPDVLWTHNDAGDDEYIFAFNLKGAPLGTWKVENARNEDWEDMAGYKDVAGKCYLYIGDIGNNKRERNQLTVYRFNEPLVSPETGSSNRKAPLTTDPADAVTFKYPDVPLNAETLMVQPASGDIYILTKRVDGPSQVFKISPQFGSTVVAQKIGEVSVPAVPNGLLTGGDISPDGKRVVICDYTAGYELQLGSAPNFDDIWKTKPVPVNLGDRKQGEAVTFSSDGSSILATSEKKNSPVIEVKRK